jgi:hypothetical protein
MLSVSLKTTTTLADIPGSNPWLTTLVYNSLPTKGKLVPDTKGGLPMSRQVSPNKCQRTVLLDLRVDELLEERRWNERISVSSIINAALLEKLFPEDKPTT